MSPVCQARLDDLIEHHSPIMIKMDVEGYEEEVLEGARVLLKNSGLKVLELETVSPAWNDLLTNVFEFERAYYDPFTRKLTRQPGGLSASNSVFVRDWTFVNSRLMTATQVEVLHHAI